MPAERTPVRLVPRQPDQEVVTRVLARPEVACVVPRDRLDLRRLTYGA
jgi:hypothetical protein